MVERSNFSSSVTTKIGVGSRLIAGNTVHVAFCDIVYRWKIYLKKNP